MARMMSVITWGLYTSMAVVERVGSFLDITTWIRYVHAKSPESDTTTVPVCLSQSSEVVMMVVERTVTYHHRDCQAADSDRPVKRAGDGLSNSLVNAWTTAMDDLVNSKTQQKAQVPTCGRYSS